MNVVFLLNSPYPYYTGGRETWLYNISQRLCKKHNVHVIVEKPGVQCDRHDYFAERDPRVQFSYATDLRNLAVATPFLRSYVNSLNEEIMLRSMWRRLKCVLKTRPDEKWYIISMDTVYTGRLGVWAKKKYPEVVFVNSVRGPHADILSDGRPLLNRYFHKQEAKTLRAADQIWSNGWDTQTTLQAQGFLSVVMKNGVDASRCIRAIPANEAWIPSETSYHLLTIGTLQDIKGYIELIKAISLLKKDYGVLVSLTAFGKGDPQKYEELARQEGVAKQICFAGVQPLTVEYAQSFDLVACLSGGGGLSMACLEALLSGTPVIAWDTPVYQQMITHEESGYLVKECDVAALAGGILWMMNHRETAQDMGQKGQAFAKSFDWNCIVHDIEHCLREN